MGIFDRKPNVEKLAAKKNIEGLIEALQHKDHDVRRHAAYALGEIRDARTVESLIQALKDQESSVRYEAARALRKIKDARAMEPLIQALKDENGIRHEAAEALGEIGDARALKPLFQALTDEYSNLIIEAVRVFGKITERANFRDAKAMRTLTSLLEALKDKEIRVQLEAVEALVQTKRPEVHTLQEKLFWFRQMQGYLEKIMPRERGSIHISEFADKLWCPHCGKPNKTEEWPINGDRVPFYFQKEPGNHNVKVQCSHCNKEWYIVWDDNPGPVTRLEDFL